MDLAEMRRRVQEARVARLATIDPAGRPHLVPVVFALSGDELLLAVDRKPKRTRDLQRLANIREHPMVAVLVDHYEEDWSRLWWVRIRGSARVVEEGADLERAAVALAEKFEPYRSEPPEGPAIVVTAEEWLGWSAE
jgi:PPOX class probable F420-dependent enzyme